MLRKPSQAEINLWFGLSRVDCCSAVSRGLSCSTQRHLFQVQSLIWFLQWVHLLPQISIVHGFRSEPQIFIAIIIRSSHFANEPLYGVM